LAVAPPSADGGGGGGGGGGGSPPSLLVADSESSSVRSMALGVAYPSRALVGGEDLLADNLFAFGDEDGRGGRARLQHPLAVAAATDGSGVAYVADSYNHKVKRLDVAGGAVASWVGAAKPGATDGAGSRAGFWEPGGLALSPDGATLYVADTNNGAIRRVDTASGSVTTLGVGGIGAILAASGGGASGAASAGGATRLTANRARARLLPALDGVVFAPATDGSLSLVVHLPPGRR